MRPEPCRWVVADFNSVVATHHGQASRHCASSAAVTRVPTTGWPHLRGSARALGEVAKLGDLLQAVLPVCGSVSRSPRTPTPGRGANAATIRCTLSSAVQEYCQDQGATSMAPAAVCCRLQDGCGISARLWDPMTSRERFRSNRTNGGALPATKTTWKRYECSVGGFPSSNWRVKPKLALAPSDLTKNSDSSGPYRREDHM